jgi:hypothetical protein
MKLRTTFSPYHHDDGSYWGERLRAVDFSYPQDEYVIGKSLLLGRSRLVRRPFMPARAPSVDMPAGNTAPPPRRSSSTEP